MTTATLEKSAAPPAVPSSQNGHSPRHATPDSHYTVAEWAAFEETKERKHQLREGKFVGMSGATYEHNAITGDFYYALTGAVRAAGCDTLPSDQRIYIANTNGLYPDVVVVCGKPEIGVSSALYNPVLIVEVLSPSTAADDRGDKFAKYRTRPTLKHYVLVEQDRPCVEHFERGENGIWSLVAEHHDVGETLTVTLNGVAAAVPLADIYRRVSFAPPEVGDDPGSD